LYPFWGTVILVDSIVYSYLFIVFVDVIVVFSSNIHSQVDI
jgi:hypothetical protein